MDDPLADGGLPHIEASYDMEVGTNSAILTKLVKIQHEGLVVLEDATKLRREEHVTNSLVLCGDVPMKNDFTSGTEVQHPNWPLQDKSSGTIGLDRRSVLDGECHFLFVLQRLASVPAHALPDAPLSQSATFWQRFARRGTPHSFPAAVARPLYGFTETRPWHIDRQFPTGYPAGYYCTAGPCTLASGRAHTCVVLQDTLSVRCFGQGEAGQLGYESSESHGGAVGSMPPPGDVQVGAEVFQVAAGGDVSCVVTTRGGIRCWGARGDGSLGNPRLAGNLGDAAGDMPPADIELGDAAVQAPRSPSLPHGMSKRLRAFDPHLAPLGGVGGHGPCLRAFKQQGRYLLGQ
ncbi:hypothetical protein CYMTET_2625 [Cymbomonas tetramitiformis]|uniref:Uncharacterized protein n=1 Tax=Cymbomonas tetramitiformis TaxID=36881 RepID=A0AAE0H6J8_9CHLO|nr:hypothetical protein CYMTET_2625 [Cymbomonas tetramitiformis]